MSQPTDPGCVLVARNLAGEWLMRLGTFDKRTDAVRAAKWLRKHLPTYIAFAIEAAR